MAQDLFSLAGKTALVTGSSRGLGFHLAEGLAEAGARVILNGSNTDRLAQAAEKMRAAGHNVGTLLMDVTNANDIDAKSRSALNDFGPVDILVNNAGIQIRGPLEEFPEEDWRHVMSMNIDSIFLVTRAFVKPMMERRRGKIINICSLLSEVGRATIAPYTASKGAVKMMTKGMATEWGRHNIQCNGIGPGYFLTEMTQALADNEEFDTWLKKRTPAGRWGEPRELKGAAVFLASEASSFVNGQILYVDGGILASL